MMDVKDVKRLIDAMSAAGLAELELEWDGSEERPGGRLALRRAVAPSWVPGSGSGSVGPAAVAAAHVEAPAAPSAGLLAAAAAPALASAVAPAPSGVEVVAPIVGTFYAAPSPDAADFVRIGDRVKVGQVLCIIEAMKLMNEIEAEVGGTVIEILVRNEEPVEYGQALFRIAQG